MSAMVTMERKRQLTTRFMSITAMMMAMIAIM